MTRQQKHQRIHQQSHGVQIRPTPIRTCVSRRPDWLAALVLQLVLLIRDGSKSMSGEKAMEATQASQDLVAELANPVNKNAFHCGVIDFDNHAKVIHPPSVAADLVGRVEPIRVNGITNIRHPLEAAQRVIDEHQSEEKGQWHPPVIVLYSDGEYNEGGDPISAADDLKRAGAVIVTVAYGTDADIDTLRAIASSPNHCYSRPTHGNELRKFMATVGRTLTVTLATGQNASRTLGNLQQFVFV